MISKNKLITDDELRLAIVSGRSKLFCINGLEVRIISHESVYFQYRLLGGKGKTKAIGKARSMSLKEAQSVAEKLRITDIESRKQQRIKRIESAICDTNKSAQKTPISISNMRALIAALRTTKSSKVTPLVRSAIYLCMAMPFSPSLLLAAQKVRSPRQIQRPNHIDLFISKTSSEGRVLPPVGTSNTGGDGSSKFSFMTRPCSVFVSPCVRNIYNQTWARSDPRRPLQIPPSVARSNSPSGG